MSKPSFEKINYALRPAKNMERKMMVEAFARLARLAPLPTYRYIGFGSIGFHDFTLLHQRLGVKDMISIEGYLKARDRVEFNRPYSCIRMKWGLSHGELPKLAWTKRTIIWLDYECSLDAPKLADIALVVSSAKSGSVLVVTVPADPGPVEQNADTAKKRLSDLKDRVGRGKVPASIAGKSLPQWGTAKACRQIIHNEILATLRNRNGPLSGPSRIKYEQLFNFHYADGTTKMLTVGGILVDSRDNASLSADHFRDLDFVRTDDAEYRIETPLLTRREIRYLDKRLPRIASEMHRPAWIPEDERKKYGRIYRYFPSFSEVEV